MVIRQYVHQLNNSELGRTGTNETYVSFPRALVPRIDFISEGTVKTTFKRNRVLYELKFKRYDNGEFRLTGLGELYRVANVDAGDLVILEKSENLFYIDFIHRKNLIVFGSQGQDRFECRNEDRLAPVIGKKMTCFVNGKSSIAEITSKGSVRPRRDSPREVNLFEIQVDGAIVSGRKNQAYNLFDIQGSFFLVESLSDSVRKLTWSEHE